jgi:hypothetical protein
VNWLALLVRYWLTFRQRDNGCKAALKNYRAVKASGASAAEVERAWLAVPHFCTGRPDKP